MVPPDLIEPATESAAQLTIYNQLRLIRERFVSKKKWVENYYQPADVVVRALGTLLAVVRDAGVEVSVTDVTTPEQARWWREVGADTASGPLFALGAG